MDIKAIDMFCGAGGFTLAAKQLGIDVVAAIENNRHACETYRFNFIKNRRIKPKLYEEDILEVDPERLLEDLELAPGELDMIMGGPPCEEF